MFHGVRRPGDKSSRFLGKHVLPHVLSDALTETYEEAFDSVRGQTRRDFFKANTKRPALIELASDNIPTLVDYEQKRRTVVAKKYDALRLRRNAVQKRKKQSRRKKKKQRLVLKKLKYL